MAQGLPWARLDVNIASHDKILALLLHRNGRGVAFSYVCSIAYTVGNGTDGVIPYAALPFLHATKTDMNKLVEVGLLQPIPIGWLIPNFGERQQLNSASKSLRAGQKAKSAKGNCVRWHGSECGCWEGKAEK